MVNRAAKQSKNKNSQNETKKKELTNSTHGQTIPILNPIILKKAKKDRHPIPKEPMDLNTDMVTRDGHVIEYMLVPLLPNHLENSPRNKVLNDFGNAP